MTKKNADALDTKPLEVPKFTTGAVADILGLPIWRVQKFVDVKSYPFVPAGRFGKASRSRRLFSTEDIYRLGIADFLLRDGFSPKFVAEVLEKFDDYDLFHV